MKKILSLIICCFIFHSTSIKPAQEDVKAPVYNAAATKKMVEFIKKIEADKKRESNIEKYNQYILKNIEGFLKDNADPNAGMEIVRLGAPDYNLMLIKVFAQHGAELNNHDENGETVLTRVIGHFKDSEAAKLLLDKGADANKANKKGESPLIVAVNKNYFKIVALLLNEQYKVNVNHKDEKGQTALFIALKKYSELKKQIEENKKDPEYDPYDQSKQIALGNIFNIIKALLNARAIPHIDKVENKSALELINELPEVKKFYDELIKKDKEFRKSISQHIKSLDIQDMPKEIIKLIADYV